MSLEKIYEFHHIKVYMIQSRVGIYKVCVIIRYLAMSFWDVIRIKVIIFWLRTKKEIEKHLGMLFFFFFFF